MSKIVKRNHEQGFKIADAADGANPRTYTGFVTIGPCGIAIHIDGLSTMVERSSETSLPILIEVLDGMPRVAVWGNKEKEEPTDVVELGQAVTDRERYGGRLSEQKEPDDAAGH